MTVCTLEISCILAHSVHITQSQSPSRSFMKALALFIALSLINCLSSHFINSMIWKLPTSHNRKNWYAAIHGNVPFLISPSPLLSNPSSNARKMKHKLKMKLSCKTSQSLQWQLDCAANAILPLAIVTIQFNFLIGCLFYISCYCILIQFL